MERLMKIVLAMLSVLLCSGVRAQAPPILYDYDPDSLSYTCASFCTAPTASATSDCPGNGTVVKKLVTTSGASSATLTSVNSDSPFSSLSKGDLIRISAGGVQYTRYILTYTSSNSVVLNSAVTVASTGVGFTWWRLVSGLSTTDAGYFVMPQGQPGVNLVSAFDQISATGGVTYKVECRNYLGTAAQTAYIKTGPTAVTSASVALTNWQDSPFDQCRFCAKITTADDDGVTITAGSNAKIDFKEPTASFSIDGTNDKIDYVEDAGGTPKVCVGTVTHNTYTAAGLVVALVEALDAPCLPDNTYTASYSSSTNKFTLTRVAGTKSVNFLWNTGANTAVSAGPTIGFPTSGDSTGATTYTGTALTTEYTATLTAGLYTGSSVCTEVETQMNAVVGPANTYACAYSATTDKITISADGSFDLPWNSGTNNATSADTALGFAADVSGASSYTGAAIGLDASNEVEKITVTLR